MPCTKHNCCCATVATVVVVSNSLEASHLFFFCQFVHILTSRVHTLLTYIIVHVVHKNVTPIMATLVCIHVVPDIVILPLGGSLSGVPHLNFCSLILELVLFLSAL